MANLNPTQQEVAPKIAEFREIFKSRNAEHIKAGVYDQRDVDRLSSDDLWAGCFLRTLKARGDTIKAAEVVHESFKFRKEIGLLDVNPSTLPTELTERNAIYYKGNDISGHPILYINVKENVSKAEHQQALRQYVAWHFEKHQKENPAQMCVVLMDMSGASTSNVGIDITKYIITCFTTYFPSFLAYMINYDMPMLLSATWSIISAFLSSEQKQKLLMVKKGDITKYIPEQHLWPHMVKK